jgi:quercetin dioxygenase-like cupin family protein
VADGFDPTKAGGGVLHALTDELHFFVLKGSLKVDVNGKPTVLNWEDVGANLSGVIRSGDKVEDTTVVAWIGRVPGRAELVPTVVRAADVFPGVGPRGGLDTPDPKKPGERSITRRYVFPGNSVRYVRMFPKGISAPHTGPLDNFIYLVEGHVQYQQGGETYEIYGGDFFIQEGGTIHEWDKKEGAIFVTSSVLAEGVNVPMDQDKIN